LLEQVAPKLWSTLTAEPTITVRRGIRSTFAATVATRAGVDGVGVEASVHSEAERVYREYVPDIDLEYSRDW
jgi:hypothetical protein